MPMPVLILRQILGNILLLMQLLLLVQAILSWVVQEDDSGGFVHWIHIAGDALTAPMRVLLGRFSFVQRCPLDLSFLATVLLLGGLRMAIL